VKTRAVKITMELIGAHVAGSVLQKLFDISGLYVMNRLRRASNYDKALDQS